ncbi:MAG: hypothetical protein WA919_10280, partial [Coleofasciculaceae cyanobacterium]
MYPSQTHFRLEKRGLYPQGKKERRTRKSLLPSALCLPRQKPWVKPINFLKNSLLPPSPSSRAKLFPTPQRPEGANSLLTTPYEK